MQQKRGNKLLVAAGVVLVCLLVVLAVVLVGRKGHNEPGVDADGNYVFGERVLERIDAATSPDVPSVAEVASEVQERGFSGYSLTSGYDMEGAMLEDESLDPLSEERHPLYNVIYFTPEGRAWVVYVCNGAYMANPLFMYDPTATQYLLVEDECVTSYSSNSNEFIRTIPDKSELVMKRVQRIDAATLDALDEEGVAGL